MSPLNVVVPRLIVPKFSPLTRTAHDNFHQKLGNVLKIFLSKRQTEIVAYFRHVTSPRRLLWNATPSQSWPIAMFFESSLRNLVCDIFAESQFCVKFTYILIRYPAQTNIKHLSCNKQPQLGCVNTSRVRPSLLCLHQQNGWK